MNFQDYAGQVTWGQKLIIQSCQHLCSTWMSLHARSWGLHLWFSAPKCLFLWNYICKSNADALNGCLLHIQILYPGGEYAKMIVPNIYLKGRIVGVGKRNYFFLKGHYKFEPKVGHLLSDHRQGMSILHVSIFLACKLGWVTETLL